MTTRNQIKEAATKLAALNHESKAVNLARSWWKTGSLYSNHDFDVLQSLNTELSYTN